MTDRWDWFARAPSSRDALPTPFPLALPPPGPAPPCLPFGETYIAIDGLQYTLSAPVPVEPRPYAIMRADFSTYAAFAVSMHNLGERPRDTAALAYDVTTGGRRSTELLDGDRFGQPPAILIPGLTLSFTLAFGYEPWAAFEVAIVSALDGPVVTYEGLVA